MKSFDLLYITFVDLDGAVNSGSGVRPIAMQRAFEELGLSVYCVDGWPNHRRKRREAVRKALGVLETHEFKACYVEPPTGPLLLHEDHRLLRRTHEKGIPMGIFYRDLFWRFDNKFHGVSWLKRRLIRLLQERDLRLFKHTMDLFFFPSPQVAEAADFDVPWMALPPGCEIHDDLSQQEREKERILHKKVPTLLYVGGILGDYGLDLLLDCMQRLNANEIRMDLELVCRQAEWEAFQTEHAVKEKSWLHVQHLQGDALLPLYEKADFSVIPFHKTPYMDFAVPVKLYEYLSHLKPIFATRCDAIADVLKKDTIGWITEPNAAALCGQMEKILENRLEAYRVKTMMVEARNRNTWLQRARTAVEEIHKAGENRL